MRRAVSARHGALRRMLQVGVKGAVPQLVLGVVAAACRPIAVEAFEPIDCNATPFDEACRFDYWPNPKSSANSDHWLAAHHADVMELRPRVLVLNFDNQARGDAIQPAIDARIAALAEGSRYLGYRDPNAPAFLRYELAGIVDFTDEDPAASPYGSSTRVPVDADNHFDPARLFGPEFAFDHPSAPVRGVELCTLFETGAINEIWIAVADGVREPPLMVERRQVYDEALSPLPGRFEACSKRASYCLDIACNVTVRIAHLNPQRGSGCDLQVRGWSFLELGATIPYFAENAAAFLNSDFRSRFGASFDSFSDICVADMPCVTYPSRTVSAADGSGTWRFDPYLQGCGAPEFPPNAAARYDWQSATVVDSRCEHYGLVDGPNGDVYEPYSASKLSVYEGLLPEDPKFPADCGGGWQMYWRQSMPGLGNAAFAADGQPMLNWWPFTFY